MITLHQIFDAALFLFGKIWPAFGAVLVIAGIITAIFFFRALCEACAPHRGSSDWTDWES